MCTKQAEGVLVRDTENEARCSVWSEETGLVERYHFYNYKQTDGQSLTDYLAELRRLLATCDWTEPQIADNLCVKFIMGLKNECLLQQLYEGPQEAIRGAVSIGPDLQSCREGIA